LASFFYLAIIGCNKEAQMSERFFRVNPNGTISLAYNNLNPSEIQLLIDKLKGNLWVLKQRKSTPQEVLLKTMRRSAGKITFQFAWDGEVHEVDLDDPDGPCLPFPDVPMSEEDWASARQFILDCVEAE